MSRTKRHIPHDAQKPNRPHNWDLTRIGIMGDEYWWEFDPRDAYANGYDNKARGYVYEAFVSDRRSGQVKGYGWRECYGPKGKRLCKKQMRKLMRKLPNDYDEAMLEP